MIMTTETGTIMAIMRQTAARITNFLRKTNGNTIATAQEMP